MFRSFGSDALQANILTKPLILGLTPKYFLEMSFRETVKVYAENCILTFLSQCFRPRPINAYFRFPESQNSVFAGEGEKMEQTSVVHVLFSLSECRL